MSANMQEGSGCYGHAAQRKPYVFLSEVLCLRGGAFPAVAGCIHVEMLRQSGGPLTCLPGRAQGRGVSARRNVGCGCSR